MEKLAFRLEVAVKTNPHLEDWFLRDPVERIVALEDALSVMGNKRKENNNENSNGVVGNGKVLAANNNHHDKEEQEEHEQEQEFHEGDVEESQEINEEEQELDCEVVEEKPLLPPETLYNQVIRTFYTRELCKLIGFTPKELELPLTTGGLGTVLLFHDEVTSFSGVGSRERRG